MLVIQVKENERVKIGDAEVYITHKGDNFRLAIEAPRDVHVLRDGAKRKEPKHATIA